jgi:hypothetical protein
MQVELYLPCIAFEVSVRPGNSSRPTDLECAALHFIAETETPVSDNVQRLEAFLGVGSAVFQDMLIRMVNRCWVVLITEGGRTYLRLSDAAREALVDESFAGMSSLEQGRSFTLCYDLIGGGFAAIPSRFRFRAMADPSAMQPLRERKSDADYLIRPYRKPLNGFLSTVGSNDPLAARIMQALQGDRVARGYLREQEGIAPELKVLSPGKVLSWSDVEFYRCRFEVYSSGTEAVEGQPIPVLRCTEQRNTAVRRLGLANERAIVEDAFANSDKRLFARLRASMSTEVVHVSGSADPLEAMLELAAKADSVELEELRQCWEVATERIRSVAESRVDAVTPLETDGIRKTVAELAAKPGSRLLIASPFIRSASPELSVDPEAMLEQLTDCSAIPLIRGITGTKMGGGAISDQNAIGRLHSALPAARVQVDEQDDDHVRTPYIASDNGCFVWLADAPFGEHGPQTGLRLDFAKEHPLQGFNQLLRTLPSGQQDWIAQSSAASPPDAGDTSPLPPKAYGPVRKIDAELAELVAEDWADPDNRARVLESVKEHLREVGSWMRLESDSAEFISGPDIQQRMANMLGPRGDTLPLVIGVSGPSDLRALPDIAELVCARLARQDLAEVEGAKLHILIAQEPFAAPALDLFLQRVGGNTPRHEVFLQPRPQSHRRLPSFIVGPASALVAHDGIVRFVPTIGRRVKAIQLGVQVLGTVAAGEVAGFLALHWPHAKDALAAVRSDEKVYTAGLSERSRKRLIETANRDGWFDDGNLGANAAYRTTSESDVKDAWEECLDRGISLLEAAGTITGGERVVTTRLGTAFLKALLIADATDPALAEAARARLAHHAVTNGDLLVATLLADELSEDDVLRNPAVRTLAYAVARQQQPQLTADDRHAIATPSPALANLCSLLMLDGFGHELIEILRAALFDAEIESAPEIDLAVALAHYQHDHGSAPVEDFGLETADEEAKIEGAVQAIVARVDSALKKSVTGLPKQVPYLRNLVFGTRGSFLTELSHFFAQEWPNLGTTFRAKALKTLLAKLADDLGFDPYQEVVTNAELKIDQRAKSYIEMKNQQMARHHRRELVDETRTRPMIASLSVVLTDLTEKIIPELIAVTDDSARNLALAVRQFREAVSRDPAPTSAAALVRSFLHGRLDGNVARAGYAVPAWRFPALSDANVPDWPGLRRAMLAHEFGPQKDLADVVGWFLGPQGDTEYTASGGDRLTRIFDLLEAARASVDPATRARLIERIEGYLSDRIGASEVDSAAARAFAEARGTAPDDEILALADQLASLREQIRVALAEGNLQDALLAAAELQYTHGRLRDAWRDASQRVREDLASGCDYNVQAELKALFSERAEAGKLADANTWLAMRPLLSRRIELESTFQYDVGDGRVPAGTGEDVLALMQILAAMRLSKPTALDDGKALEQAILRFLSRRQPEEFACSTTRTNDVWRITSTHPAFCALSPTHRQVELLVPRTYEAESQLRMGWKEAARDAQDETWLRMTRAATKASPSSAHPVLLALFSSNHESGAEVINWRRLAMLGKASLFNRRIGILSELGRQTFAARGSVAQWWQSLSAESKFAALAAIVERPNGWYEETAMLSDLVTLSGDACLALGQLRSRSTDSIELSEAGRRTIALAWSKCTDTGNLDCQVDVRTLLDAMDELLTQCSDQ